jgi:hypothetical protein
MMSGAEIEVIRQILSANPRSTELSERRKRLAGSSLAEAGAFIRSNWG